MQANEIFSCVFLGNEPNGILQANKCANDINLFLNVMHNECVRAVRVLA